MIVDCCSQQRTYEKFYGLLAGRFCQLRREHMERFEVLFGKQYEVIHRLETNKLRNVAKVSFLFCVICVFVVYEVIHRLETNKLRNVAKV